MPKVAYSEEDRERIRTQLVAVGLELMAKQGKYYALWNLQQGIFRKREEPKPVVETVSALDDEDDDDSITY